MGQIHSLLDLPDELIMMVLNELPAMDQVAVSRVCRKFKQLALRTTPILDVRDVPDDHRLHLAKMMPKLSFLGGIKGSITDEDDFMYCGEEKEEELIRDIAAFNKNITRFAGIILVDIDGANYGTLDISVQVYIESIKEYDPSYNGSNLKYTFSSYDLKYFLETVPDLKVRSYIMLYEEPEHEGSDLSNALVSHLEFCPRTVDYAVSIIKMLPNVYDLLAFIKPGDKSFKLHQVLDTIARLPLKRLRMSFGKDEDKPLEYSMTSNDYSSLQNVLNIPTLRSLAMVIQFPLDTQAMINCFKGSFNKRFNHFSDEEINNFVVNMGNRAVKIRRENRGKRDKQQQTFF